MGWFVLVVIVCMSMGISIRASEEKGYEMPLNCKKVECASYEVIDSQKEYQIREYKKAMWVSALPINSSSYEDGAYKGFNILFSYIQGNNEEAAQLNMTAPVFVDIIPSKDPLSNSTFVVNFLLPNNYQKNPPPSTLAHPVELPKQNYAAVRRFGGFISDNEIPLQVLALEKSLNGTKWESSIVKKSKGNAMTYTIAGYNSPFDKENRVNEIIFWFDK
ncbi:hypothetical protein Patl1_05413 [Pistacia atlantica]|uniref:Uncharacterized protein n=1 Tax=Pistacia atlantica TaxID=434234 RepID=A0ACC1BVN6_9ROSI|nr:hypothetical protein Patl1_05413 [Pistacia atlantica]